MSIKDNGAKDKKLFRKATPVTFYAGVREWKGTVGASQRKVEFLLPMKSSSIVNHFSTLQGSLKEEWPMESSFQTGLVQSGLYRSILWASLL